MSKHKKSNKKKKPANTSGKDKSAKWAKRLVTDVWPQERDFFERPERYRYVRKLLPETGCVFCNAEKAKPGKDSLVLARDEHVQVLMNKYPYNTGHLLVMPRAHIGEIWVLSEEVNARLAWWLRESTRILKGAFTCQGFNLGLNHGAVAGAGIPDHLHWHIVPRWGGDTNFFPLIAETKVLPETLEQTYNRLRPLFEQAGK